MDDAIRIHATIALAASLVVWPAEAASEPVRPTGKWEVQYSDRACTAKRPYGGYVLGIQPSPLGMTTRYIVEGPGKIDRSRQYESTIEFTDGGPSIMTSSLIYPLKVRGRRGVLTILSLADAERIAKTGRLQISSELRSRKRGGKLAMSGDRLSVDLEIKSTPALIAALSECMADLRKIWGIVDGKLPDPISVATSRSPLRGLFTGDDYPSDAMAADQIGASQALLLVDERGRVADCVTVMTSGAASIDAVVCQVIEERARFSPALDLNGNPTKSTVLTPPIRFVISQ